MRFFYLDPGLVSNVGHHANTCRVVTTELRRRGIETFVVASARVFREIQTALQAIPFFSFYTYEIKGKEPLVGWLSTFLRGVAATTSDLGRLRTTAEDVVYLNSAQPAQFMSLISWMHGLPQDQRPRVVLEFGTDAGLTVKPTGDGYAFESKNPADDPHSVLYRYIGLTFPEDLRKHIFPMTFDTIGSEGFTFITGCKTGVLPLPQEAYAPLRKKAGKRPIVVGVLGQQRAEKGYKLVPGIIKTLLPRHPEIMFLVHNGAGADADVFEVGDAQRAIRMLKGTTHRLAVDERPADDRLWRYLFAGTDIILCPYERTTYLTGYSAIAAEALANGMPMVVPAGTTLSRFAENSGGASVTFGEYSESSIADAVGRAVNDFDALAERAFAAAETWNRSDRKALLVDSILGRA